MTISAVKNKKTPTEVSVLVLEKLLKKSSLLLVSVYSDNTHIKLIQVYSSSLFTNKTRTS